MHAPGAAPGTEVNFECLTMAKVNGSCASVNMATVGFVERMQFFVAGAPPASAALRQHRDNVATFQ